MEKVEYKGWKNCIRLSNKEIELIVTSDVGPRIIRFGFIGNKNVLGEIPEEIGKKGEKKWKIRGGHRLWIAPEDRILTYEPDNTPVTVEEIPEGIRTIQPAGPLTGIKKIMEIELKQDHNLVFIRHIIIKESEGEIQVAPWALTVMAKRGCAIIPLPAKIPHSKRLTFNQNWTLWGYTDLSDSRWKFLPNYLLFFQSPQKGPNKLGIAHREGWVAYYIYNQCFIKYFKYIEGATYPDSNVNFETFSNELILELESLGPLVTLKKGDRMLHTEAWTLHRNVNLKFNQQSIDKNLKKLIDKIILEKLQHS